MTNNTLKHYTYSHCQPMTTHLNWFVLADALRRWI